MVPLYSGGSSLWVGLDGWLVKVSWLGKVATVFWWVELDLFSLECNEVSSGEFGGVSGFGVSFGRLYFCVRVMFLGCLCISWYVLLWNLLALGWSLVSV